MEQGEAEVGDEVGVKTEDGNVREEIFCRCLKGGGGVRQVMSGQQQRR